MYKAGKGLKNKRFCYTRLPSTSFRQLEANPFKMRGFIFWHVKIRALAFFMILLWMVVLELELRYQTRPQSLDEPDMDLGLRPIEI